MEKGAQSMIMGVLFFGKNQIFLNGGQMNSRTLERESVPPEMKEVLCLHKRRSRMAMEFYLSTRPFFFQ